MKPRPVLRYHGGKWLLAPWIIRQFPPHRVYTEAFGGGASVLMHKRRHRLELERLLRATPFARAEYELAFELTDDPIERARRTIMRSFMGFGSNSIRRHIRSGFRSNANRNGTTPAHDWANYPEALAEMESRLAGVVIEHRPAIEVIQQHDGPKTLHYIDPPYVHSTRMNGVAGKGYDHEMSDADHRELAEQLHEMAGMVIVSGYPPPLYDEDLFPDWHRVERPARTDGARPRVEVLWANAAARAAGRGLFEGRFA